MKLTKKQQEFIREGHKDAGIERKAEIEAAHPNLFGGKSIYVDSGWYYATCIGIRGYLCHFSNPKETLGGEYWFTPNGISFINGGLFDRIERPATDYEVFEALKKEAIKRGFKNGVRYDASNIGFKDQISRPMIDGYFTYINGRLLFSNWVIFRGGKWAEVIKTISKEEAEKKLGVQIKCDS